MSSGFNTYLAGSDRPICEVLPAAGGSTGHVHSGTNPLSAFGIDDSTTENFFTWDLMQECGRIVAKSFPANAAFHRLSLIQKLKNTTLDIALVCALLTTAARNSTMLINQYGYESCATCAAKHFADESVDFINQGLDDPTLTDIQAMCLITIHEWGSGNAQRAYIYLGQAARMIQTYRTLNDNNQQSESADLFLQEENFRRTVWLLYILDSLLVSTPGRHAAMPPEFIADVSLPCSDMNFTSGKAVYVKTLSGADPSRLPFGTPTAEVGEFGHVVLAAKIWRDVVQMLKNTTTENFDDAACAGLLVDIEKLRLALPALFDENPDRIKLHITRGSSFTYAMIHCFLNSSHVIVHRRRLLELVKSNDFNFEAYLTTMSCHETVDWLLSSCHSTLAMMNALETGSNKDSIKCLPIFMLFSAFTAGSTAAYLNLKGLTSPNAVEMATHIVRDSMHFVREGAESWPLAILWNRHLTYMYSVLTAELNLVNSTTISVQFQFDCGSSPTPSQSMTADKLCTAAELCTEFERQLLKLDDLGALTGGFF